MTTKKTSLPRSTAVHCTSSRRFLVLASAEVVARRASCDVLCWRRLRGLLSDPASAGGLPLLGSLPWAQLKILLRPRSSRNGRWLPHTCCTNGVLHLPPPQKKQTEESKHQPASTFADQSGISSRLTLSVGTLNPTAPAITDHPIKPPAAIPEVMASPRGLGPLGVDFPRNQSALLRPRCLLLSR